MSSGHSREWLLDLSKRGLSDAKADEVVTRQLERKKKTAKGDALGYQEVDVSQNQISWQGCTRIVDLCLKCTDLRVVKLFRNEIGDRSAPSLCRLVERCDALEQLHLSYNQLTEVGAQQLINAAQTGRINRRTPDGSVTLWLRLENNRIRNPTDILECLWHQGINFCEARDAQKCGPRICKRQALIHLPYFSKQDVVDDNGSDLGKSPKAKPVASPYQLVPQRQSDTSQVGSQIAAAVANEKKAMANHTVDVEMVDSYSEEVSVSSGEEEESEEELAPLAPVAKAKAFSVALAKEKIAKWKEEKEKDRVTAATPASASTASAETSTGGQRDKTRKADPSPSKTPVLDKLAKSSPAAAAVDGRPVEKPSVTVIPDNSPEKSKSSAVSEKHAKKVIDNSSGKLPATVASSSSALPKHDANVVDKTIGQLAATPASSSTAVPDQHPTAAVSNPKTEDKVAPAKSAHKSVGDENQSKSGKLPTLAQAAQAEKAALDRAGEKAALESRAKSLIEKLKATTEKEKLKLLKAKEDRTVSTPSTVVTPQQASPPKPNATSDPYLDPTDEGEATDPEAEIEAELSATKPETAVSIEDAASINGAAKKPSPEKVVETKTKVSGKDQTTFAKSTADVARDSIEIETPKAAAPTKPNLVTKTEAIREKGTSPVKESSSADAKSKENAIKNLVEKAKQSVPAVSSAKPVEPEPKSSDVQGKEPAKAAKPAKGLKFGCASPLASDDEEEDKPIKKKEPAKVEKGAEKGLEKSSEKDSEKTLEKGSGGSAQIKEKVVDPPAPAKRATQKSDLPPRGSRSRSRRKYRDEPRHDDRRDGRHRDKKHKHRERDEKHRKRHHRGDSFSSYSDNDRSRKQRKHRKESHFDDGGGKDTKDDKKDSSKRSAEANGPAQATDKKPKTEAKPDAKPDAKDAKDAKSEAKPSEAKPSEAKPGEAKADTSNSKVETSKDAKDPKASPPKAAGGAPAKAAGNILGNLAELQKKIAEERDKLRLFVIKAKQDWAEAREKKGADGKPISGVTDEHEYYQAKEGESFGPEKRFASQASIGRGVFSSVFRCKDKVSGMEYAVKFTRKNPMMRKAAEKEIEMYKRLAKQAPKVDSEGAGYLISLAGGQSNFGTFEHAGHLCMAFDLHKCDLRFGLQKYGQGKGLPLPTVQQYGRQLLMGLRLLRSLKIIHGDLKPDNLLMSMDKTEIRIIDFGSAFDVAEQVHTAYVQPRYYRAPEIMLGLEYDTQIDLWSAGATLYELATGKILFNGKTNNSMLKLMLDACGSIPKRMATDDNKYGKKHFNANGDFLLKDPQSLTGQDQVIPMRKFKEPVKPIEPLMEKNISDAPAGVKADVHKRMVKNIIDVTIKLLRLDPQQRITPELALNLDFFNVKKN